MIVVRTIMVLVMVMVVCGDDRVDVPVNPVRANTCDIHCKSMAVSSLLQALGFSPTCVSTTLTLCSQLKDENNFAALVEDMRGVMDELRPRPSPECTTVLRAKNCKDLLDQGDSGQGLREIYPFRDKQEPVTVYCDQITDGGGWTVFQRRTNTTPRENFERSWAEYQEGFGNKELEVWSGLALLHELSLSAQELRIDLADYEGGHRWAKYRDFKVGPTQDHYRLTVGSYTGDAGDSLTYHNGMQFSTHDGDHDTHSLLNCASTYRGGWWYNSCHDSNLNGYYHEGTYTGKENGIVWQHWKGNHYSLMNITMMIRPI